MKTFQIYEWTATVYVYEVEAEDLEDAKRRVQFGGEGRHIPEYDRVVDRDYFDASGELDPFALKQKITGRKQKEKK